MPTVPEIPGEAPPQEGDENLLDAKLKRINSSLDAEAASKPKKAEPSGFEVMLNRVWSREVGRMTTTTELSRALNEKAAFDILTLSDKAKLPPEIVGADYESIKNREAMGAWDRDKYLRESPIAASYLQKSQYHAGSLSWNDILVAGKAEAFLNRPPQMWPLMDKAIEAEAKRDADREWNRHKEGFASQQADPSLLDPVPTGGGEAVAPIPLREPSEADRKLYYERHLKRIREREDFISGETPQGTGEVLYRKYSKNPMAWAPFGSEVEPLSSAIELWQAATADEKGVASDEQKELLTNFARVAMAEERRGRRFTAQVADMVTSAVPFAVEMGLTFGAYAGPAKAAKAAVAPLLAKVTEKYGIRKGLEATTGWAVGSLAESAVHAVVKAPRGALERTMPTGALMPTKDGKGFVYKVDTAGEEAYTAIPKALLDVFAETASERAGGVFDAAIDKATGGLFGKIAKKLGYADKVMYQKLSAGLKRAGVNGVIAEFGEERLADMIRVAGGTPFKLPTLEQAAVEFAGFSLMRAVPVAAGVMSRRKMPPGPTDGQAGQTVGVLKATLEASDNPDAIKPILREALDQTPTYIPLQALEGFAQEAAETAPGRRPTAREVVQMLGGSGEAYDHAIENNLPTVQLPGSARLLAIELDEQNAPPEPGPNAPPLSPEEQAKRARKVKLLDEFMDDPEAVSKEDLKEILTAAQKSYQQDTEREKRTEEIVEDFAKRLEGTKRVTKEQANANARIFAAITESVASRAGISPVDLYNLTVPRIMAAVEGEADPAQGFDQPAYHGSPHKYDRVDLLNNAGEGEGGAMKGWGFYAAQVRDVAKKYRFGLTHHPSRVTVDGKQLGDYWTEDSQFTQEEYSAIKEAFSIAKGMSKEKSFAEDDISTPRKILDIAYNNARWSSDQGQRDLSKKLWNLINDPRIEKATFPDGRLYTLDIPEDAELLDLDASINDQPEKVKRAIEAIKSKWLKKRRNPVYEREDKEGTTGTGMNFYMWLAGQMRSAYAQQFGGPGIKEKQAASELLLAHGVKGARYLDQKSRGDGEGTRNYVIYDQNLVKITGFEHREGGSLRGHYTPAALNNGEAVVRLFKSLTPDTVPHELTHHWVSTVSWMADHANAHPNMKAFAERMLEAMGFKGTLAEWNALDQDAQRPYHEGLANAFPKYLATGKAPSGKLEEVFRAFMNWIKEMWRRIKGGAVGMEVDPRMAEFFDMLVATDEELQAASYDSGLQSQFTAQELGLSDKSAMALNKLLERAYGNAFDEVYHRMSESIRQKRTREYIREEREVREQVTKQAQERRDIRALSILQKGRLPDGTKVPKEQRLKLLRSAVDEFAPGLSDLLPSGTVVDKDGVSPDLAAGALGYPSGAELLDDLANAERAAREAGAASEVDIRDRIREAERKVEALQKLAEPVEGDREAARKTVESAAVRGLASKLEKAIKREADASIGDLKALLDGVRQRKIAPSDTWKDAIPKPFRAKKSETGVPIDELAQESYDRGIIADPSPDTLIKFLSDAQAALANAKARKADAGKEATRQARALMEASVETLIDTTEELADLKEQVQDAKKALAAARADASGASAKRWIDSEVKAVMDSRHADLEYSPAALHDAALKAVNTEATAEVLRIQMERLRQMAPAAATAMSRKIGMLLPSDARVKAMAENTMNAMSPQDIHPGRYRIAKEKAAREARKAFEAGDIAGAAEAKRVEAANHALYVAALEAKEFANGIPSWANRYDQAPLRKKIGKAGNNFLEAIDEILGSANLSPMSKKGMEALRGAAAAWVAKHEEAWDTNSAVPRWVVQGLTRNWREMSIGDLKGLVEGVEQIETVARAETEMLDLQDRRSLEEVKQALLASMARTKEKTGTMQVPLEPRKKSRAWYNATRAGLAEHEAISNVLRHLDALGHGEFSDFVMKRLVAAAEREYAVQQEYQKLITDAAERRYGKDWRKEFRRFEKSMSLPGDPEALKGMSRQGRIAVFLNWGNAGNRVRLLEGLQKSYDPNLTEYDIQRIIDSLDERDREFAQDILDILETLWPESSKVMREITGAVPPKVEALPIISGGKVYRGGYYPAVRERLISAKQAIEEDADALAQKRHLMKLVGPTVSGSMKERTGVTGEPLRLDLGPIFEHIQELAHVNTHMKAVWDIHRVLRDHDIARSAQEIVGPDRWAQVTGALTDVAKGEPTNRSASARWWLKLRAGWQISALALNTVTVMKQAGGLAQAVPRVGAANLARATSRWASMGIAERREMVEFIHTSSPSMASRIQTMNQDLNEIRSEIGPKTGLSDRIMKAMFYPIAWAQHFMVDIPVWMASYSKHMEALAGTEDAHETASHRATQDVLDTQGGGQTKDLPAIQRGTDLMRLFTAFFTYTLRTMNLSMEAVRGMRMNGESKIKHAWHLFWLLATPVFFEEAIAQLVEASRGDEPDEEDSLVKRIAKRQLQQILNLHVLTRQFTGAFDSRGDYQGPAGLRSMSDLFFLIKQSKQFLDENEDNDFDEPLFKAVMRVGGGLLGLPGLQAERTLLGIKQMLQEGGFNPFKILFGPSKN